MPWTVAVLTWIAVTTGQIAAWLIHALVSKYALRALAVAAAAGAFWLSFAIVYDVVKGLLDDIVLQAQQSQATLGLTMEFGLCLLPTTIPEAMSVLMAILLQAVTIKWFREIMFLKLA